MKDRSAYFAARYQAKKGQIRVVQAAYCRANRDRVNANKRSARRANPALYKAIAKRWRLKNPVRYRAIKRRWRRAKESLQSFLKVISAVETLKIERKNEKQK